MVLGGEQRHAGVGERAAHAGIALQGVRVVIVVGEHRLHLQCLRERRQRLVRHALPHDEACTLHPVRLAQRTQLRVQVHEAVANELDAPVGPGQRREQLGVEHEAAPDPPRLPQGVVQGRLVLDAQVAAEPHERGVEGLVHAARWAGQQTRCVAVSDIPRWLE
jgi:hypothetical protein